MLRPPDPWPSRGGHSSLSSWGYVVCYSKSRHSRHIRTKHRKSTMWMQTLPLHWGWIGSAPMPFLAGPVCLQGYKRQACRIRNHSPRMSCLAQAQHSIAKQVVTSCKCRRITWQPSESLKTMRHAGRPSIEPRSPSMFSQSQPQATSCSESQSWQNMTNLQVSNNSKVGKVA